MTGRFVKGQSGNPSGRPRKSKEPPPSAFDVIAERTLAVCDNGVVRSLSVDEALQLKTYQDAIGGSRMAQREVMRMIAKREAWLAKRRTPKAPMPVREEYPDQPNATPALRLLGIVAPIVDQPDEILLEPWAVELALTRRGGVKPTEIDIRAMSVRTRGGMALRSRYRVG